MRMITRMLLASVLAIAGASFGGCGDTDCPATFAQGASCSTQGLSCTAAGASCTCNGGVWVCNDDLPFPIVHDMSLRDLAKPSD